MIKLENEHPQIHDHYMQGGFSVQLGPSNTFGKIPIDQTIEETANKDTQTPGGTKGFSLKAGSISKFYLTAEYRSTSLKMLREMIQVQAPGVAHADLELSRIKRDEHDVQVLVDMLENIWINPFIGQSDIVSLSTGSVAPMDIQHDLIDAKKKGDTAYQSFVHDRLEVETPSQNFYDRLPKMQLKTFGDMTKTKKTKATNKEISLKADN